MVSVASAASASRFHDLVEELIAVHVREAGGTMVGQWWDNGGQVLEAVLGTVDEKLVKEG